MILKIMQHLQKAVKGIKSATKVSGQRNPALTVLACYKITSKQTVSYRQNETNNLFLKQSGNFQVAPGTTLTYKSLQTLKVEVLFSFKKVK